MEAKQNENHLEDCSSRMQQNREKKIKAAPPLCEVKERMRREGKEKRAGGGA